MTDLSSEYRKDNDVINYIATIDDKNEFKLIICEHSNTLKYLKENREKENKQLRFVLEEYLVRGMKSSDQLINVDWANSLVGLRMNVLNCWWPGYSGTSQNYGTIVAVVADDPDALGQVDLEQL